MDHCLVPQLFNLHRSSGMNAATAIHRTMIFQEIHHAIKCMFCHNVNKMYPITLHYMIWKHLSFYPITYPYNAWFLPQLFFLVTKTQKFRCHTFPHHFIYRPGFPPKTHGVLLDICLIPGMRGFNHGWGFRPSATPRRKMKPWFDTVMIPWW